MKFKEHFEEAKKYRDSYVPDEKTLELARLAGSGPDGVKVRFLNELTDAELEEMLRSHNTYEAEEE